MDNSRYQEGIQNPRIRQHFLNELRRVEPLPFVNRITYSSKDYFQHAMRTKSSLMASLGLRGTKSDIVVYPFSFDLKIHEDIAEFSSTLFDREGYKARRAFENPEAAGLNLIDILKATAIGMAFPPFLGEVNKKIDEKIESKALHRFCTSLHHLIMAKRRGINGAYLKSRVSDLSERAEEVKLDEHQLADLYTRKVLELNVYKR